VPVVAPSLRMPVAGRSIAGVVALIFAGPMCRLTGLTDDPSMARKIGVALAMSDFVGVARVVAASSSSVKRAALVNAALDVLLASALLGLGTRRQGRERILATLASASVWFGAGAWSVGAYQLRD